MVNGGTHLSSKLASMSADMSNFIMYLTKMVQSWHEGSSRRVFDSDVNLSYLVGLRKFSIATSRDSAIKDAITAPTYKNKLQVNSKNNLSKVSIIVSNSDNKTENSRT